MESGETRGLEGLSDGVFAIVITLLLLNLLLLLAVTVFPFPTALVAALLYTGIGVLLAIFFALPSTNLLVRKLQ